MKVQRCWNCLRKVSLELFYLDAWIGHQWWDDTPEYKTFESNVDCFYAILSLRGELTEAFYYEVEE